MVALATTIVGCGPDVGGSAGASSTSTMASEGSDSSSSTDGRTWPEDSVGAFYLEHTIPLGIVANYIAALSNLELTREGLVVTHLGCDGDDLREELVVEYQGAEAHVRPLPGDPHVMWRGGPMAAELIFRPGPTCDTLELEIIEPFPGYPGQWRWFRGALFITDTCGPSDYEWAVDLRPDVPTECPSSG